MREIKFRTWDIEFNRMKVTGMGISHGVLDGEEVEIMQYTGLHDKNGKEIYEGDIVRQQGESFGDEPPRFSTWEVIWFSGTFDINGGEYAGIATGFWVKHIEGCRWAEAGAIEGLAEQYAFANYGGNGGVCTNDCEVIGNIYENPELLESK